MKRLTATILALVLFAAPAGAHTAGHTSCEWSHGLNAEGQWGHITGRFYEAGNIYVPKHHYYYGPGPGRGNPIYKHSTLTVCGHY